MKKKQLVVERGTLARIYGVPLHAWNVNFFKLCVFDIGRLLKIDDFTMEKEKFDYTRLLVATKSFDILNTSGSLMVDRVLLEFKIIEEWGFSLGEDACLFDEGDAKDLDTQAHDADHLVSNDHREVEVLVDQISKDWEEPIDTNHLLRDSSPPNMPDS